MLIYVKGMCNICNGIKHLPKVAVKFAQHRKSTFTGQIRANMSIKTLKTDFQRIISDLVAVGWSERALARKFGVTQPSISQLKTGRTKQPKYDLGAALVRLHKEEMIALDERKKEQRSK